MSEYSRAKVCAVCARVLDFVEGRGWIHGLADPEAYDHPAVPVDHDEVTVRGRCDFCYADGPTWVLPARDFQTGDNTGSDGNWSACDPCAALIEKNEWTALRRRVVASYEERHPEVKDLPDLNVDHDIARLHRTLRKNITGALRPL